MGKQARCFGFGRLNQFVLNLLVVHFFIGNFGQLGFEREQALGVEVFGGDVDVERTVFVVAVGQRVKLEASFAVDEFARFGGLGIKAQFTDFDGGRGNRAGRIDECADLQVGNEVDQFVQFDVVVYAFLPFEQEFVEGDAAFSQRQFVLPFGGFGFQVQVFQSHAAFVGQFDL